MPRPGCPRGLCGPPALARPCSARHGLGTAFRHGQWKSFSRAAARTASKLEASDVTDAVQQELASGCHSSCLPLLGHHRHDQSLYLYTGSPSQVLLTGTFLQHWPSSDSPPRLISALMAVPPRRFPRQSLSDSHSSMTCVTLTGRVVFPLTAATC